MSILSTIRAILTLGRGVTVGLTELEAGPDPIALFREWFPHIPAAARRRSMALPV